MQNSHKSIFRIFALLYSFTISVCVWGQSINCDDAILILDNSNISSDTLAASDTLTSSSSITGGTVLFQSPQCIFLKENFQVAQSVAFQAQIDDCLENIDCGVCSSGQTLDSSRGACDVTLSFSNTLTISKTSTNRIIETNSIPTHKVGLFGGGMGSLNPNAISEQDESYTISLNPIAATSFTELLNTTGNAGPKYSFGVLLNGVELDPVAAEPFPHTGRPLSANVNWEWNLEALNVNLGLDCNNAHVQPTGKYHYHGSPSLYLDNINVDANTMTLIGYAADGFPIYYKYGYTDATDNTSGVSIMTPSYQLKTGCRPGDGVTAPCGEYNGVYSNDYEYVLGSGTLDEANGRTSVTPEFPSGTYYYTLTDEFPAIPRKFRGTPSNDFRIGG